MHAHDTVLASEQNRALLVRSLYTGAKPTVAMVKGALRLIDHRLATGNADGERCDNLILLMHSIVSTTPPSIGDRAELALFVLRLDGTGTHFERSLPSDGRAGACGCTRQL